LEELGEFTIADGVPEMLGAVRTELKKGASQIKLAASGGVISDYDPIDSLQFTPSRALPKCHPPLRPRRVSMYPPSLPIVPWLDLKRSTLRPSKKSRIASAFLTENDLTHLIEHEIPSAAPETASGRAILREDGVAR
jgi:hypothetical protein